MINNKFYSIYIFLLIIGLFSFNFISAGLRTSSNTYTSNTINIINNDTELFHNNMSGIQGGVGGQYYHIRESWYDELLSDIFEWLTSDEADTKISNANTTMKSYVDLLNASGLIKNWNATGLIANWSIADLNATGLVKDWNATGLIKTWTDTDTFVGNYSTFLNHITWANVYNGTMAKTSDLINYNSSNLIIDWNSTGYIKDWNVTGLIANWSIDTSSFLTSESDPKWGANYSTYLTKPTWANVINGTVALQTTVNTNVTTANLHTHKAENITAGTFGTGNYVFDSNVTMDCLLFATGGKICGV